ncbi:DUF3396 domain-containing protein [Archangium violaceum]|uniref:type VI immunity family protein n=1 Tax=Archangium violaceum TaxID=83451 RepID=UPI002B2B68AA|nr:DUF3396 domain-containing protein [Archangium violaceum]
MGMTTMRYPRLRYQNKRGWLVASDALLMCFYIRHPHQQIAQAVMRALELFRERIHPYRLTWYAGDGQAEPLDDSAWEAIRQEMLGPNDGAFVQMEDGSRWTGKLYVDYRGLPIVPLPFEGREDDVSVLYLRLPTEYLEERGAERVHALALELAQELPFHSGYTDFVLCEAGWTGEAIDLVRPRYPGVELAPSSANLRMNTWVDGVHWMNFLGQPVLGQLGGVDGLRERLTLPGVSIQEMSGERVLITLGDRPETGDVEAGQTLPLHRALARLLEPHLYHRTTELSRLSPEEWLRWERRFLD